jgi:cellulose biosynthesis protein BcsQ
MGKVIAVFGAKGGVGKSTIIMMLAEALSGFQAKKVLVIDADPQTSVSIMLTPKREGVSDSLQNKCWDFADQNKRTLVDFFVSACRNGDSAAVDCANYDQRGLRRARSPQHRPDPWQYAACAV